MAGAVDGGERGFDMGPVGGCGDLGRERDERVFYAGMELERRPLTGGSLARALLRYPLQTFRIHAAIYIHAALLWWKRTPFFTNPSTRSVAQDATPTS